MSHQVQSVVFHGQDFVLIGNTTDGGALATIEEYEHGYISYAHLTPDGRILRLGCQLGIREELEMRGLVDVTLRFNVLASTPSKIYQP